MSLNLKTKNTTTTNFSFKFNRYKNEFYDPAIILTAGLGCAAALNVASADI